MSAVALGSPALANVEEHLRLLREWIDKGAFVLAPVTQMTHLDFQIIPSTSSLSNLSRFQMIHWASCHTYLILKCI